MVDLIEKYEMLKRINSEFVTWINYGLIKKTYDKNNLETTPLRIDYFGLDLILRSKIDSVNETILIQLFEIIPSKTNLNGDTELKHFDKLDISIKKNRFGVYNADFVNLNNDLLKGFSDEHANHLAKAYNEELYKLLKIA